MGFHLFLAVVFGLLLQSWSLRTGTYRKDKRHALRVQVGVDGAGRQVTVWFNGDLQVVESPSFDASGILVSFSIWDRKHTRRFSYRAVSDDVMKQLDDESMWVHSFAFNHSAGLSTAAAASREFCEDIFARKNEAPALWPPPSEVPPQLLHAFTMNGRIPVIKNYVAEKQNGGEGYVWSREEIERNKLDIRRGSRRRVCYNSGVCAEAIKSYPVAGQRGIVFGSQRPWAESLLLEKGAVSVTTYEYMAIESDHPQLSTVTPIQVAKDYLTSSVASFKRFDFGFSYSSFEHAGLGRYGDPLDPIADMVSIAKAACLIKPSGIFYLGLPVGRDALVFNSHRIYGNIRLPHVLRHFELLEIVGPWSVYGGLGNFSQPILVLRNRNEKS